MDWLVLSNKFEILIKEERRKERSVSMFRWWSFVKRKKEEIQVRIIIDNRRKRKIVDVMRNVLCFLWIVAILKIEDFVIAEADPAILLGSDLSHFQQVRKIFCLIYSSSSSFFFLEGKEGNEMSWSLFWKYLWCRAMLILWWWPLMEKLWMALKELMIGEERCFFSFRCNDWMGV